MRFVKKVQKRPHPFQKRHDGISLRLDTKPFFISVPIGVMHFPLNMQPLPHLSWLVAHPDNVLKVSHTYSHNKIVANLDQFNDSVKRLAMTSAQIVKKASQNVLAAVYVARLKPVFYKSKSSAKRTQETGKRESGTHPGWSAYRLGREGVAHGWTSMGDTERFPSRFSDSK